MVFGAFLSHGSKEGVLILFVWFENDFLLGEGQGGTMVYFAWTHGFISLFFFGEGWGGHVQIIKKKQAGGGIYLVRNANSKSETVIENDVL